MRASLMKGGKCMFTIITPSHNVEEVSYRLAFEDEKGNGFAFPCDKDGKPLSNLDPAAIKNYEWALSHPEEFARYNEVIQQTDRYHEPHFGKCECGEKFSLWNEYMGARQCPKCGRWYNLFGQELRSPNEWGEDY